MRKWLVIGLVIGLVCLTLSSIGAKGCFGSNSSHHTGSSAPLTPSFTTIDAIGHLDGSGDPVYTRGGINDLDASGLYCPGGVALDEINFRLFVADGGNNRVLVYNLNGDLTLPDREADFVLGQPDFNSDAYATTQNKLEYPTGLAYDSPNNRLFVADYGNNRVLVFDVATITNGEDAISVLGQADFSSGSFAGGPNRLQEPYDLIYDQTNSHLFVADTAHNRVMVFDVTTITNGEDAVNVLGQPDFNSYASSVTTSTLNAPVGLTYDSPNSRLFVADRDNNRVMAFDVTTITNGEDATNVLGQSDFISNSSDTTTNTLSAPGGLSYDSTNSRLFVADTGYNNRVMVFDVATINNGEDAINVLGQTDFTSYNWATTQNGLRLYDTLASGLACANNRLFVTDQDNNRLMVFDVATITNGENAVDALGHIDDVGTPIYTSGGVNNPDAISLYYPGDTALDTVNHRLFVADASNNRVLVYNLNNDLTLPDREADFVLGQPDFYSSSGATSQNGLKRPYGLVYDDTNSRLFVAGGNRVMVFDVATITNGENAINVLGQANFTSISGTSTAQSILHGPYGLVYDDTNSRLFVADGGNQRVMVFDVATIDNGEDAINVLGQSDFDSDTAATTQNGFYYSPLDVAYDDTNGRLFVADSGNNRVMVFDVATIDNGEDAINVLGQSNFTISTTATTQNGFYSPRGLSYDNADKYLFVADASNQRVMVFDVATITNNENAISVLGQSDFTSKTPATTQNGLRSPWGLVYNSANSRLFVADLGNNRVMVYTVNY